MSALHARLDSHEVAECATAMSDADASALLDAMIFDMQLCSVKRYHSMKYWSDETEDSLRAERIEGNPRLESVADHSWHMCAMLVHLKAFIASDQFARSLELGIVHDLLETITGDHDPIGRDGQGLLTYAFNRRAHVLRKKKDLAALQTYRRLFPKATTIAHLVESYEDLTDPASCIVHSVDKIQPLLFILKKKGCDISLEHLAFTWRYTRKAVDYWPPFEPLWRTSFDRVMNSLVKKRRVTKEQLLSFLSERQLSFPGF